MRKLTLLLGLLVVGLVVAPAIAQDGNAIWNGSVDDDLANTSNYLDTDGLAITTLADANVIITTTAFTPADPPYLPATISDNLTDGDGLRSLTFNGEYTGPLSIDGGNEAAKLYDFIRNENADMVTLGLGKIEITDVDGDNTVTLDGGTGGLTLNCELQPEADGRTILIEGTVNLAQIKDARKDLIFGGSGTLTITTGTVELDDSATFKDDITVDGIHNFDNFNVVDNAAITITGGIGNGYNTISGNGIVTFDTGVGGMGGIDMSDNAQLIIADGHEVKIKDNTDNLIMADNASLAIGVGARLYVEGRANLEGTVTVDGELAIRDDNGSSQSVADITINGTLTSEDDDEHYYQNGGTTTVTSGGTLRWDETYNHAGGTLDIQSGGTLFVESYIQTSVDAVLQTTSGSEIQLDENSKNDSAAMVLLTGQADADPLLDTTRTVNVKGFLNLQGGNGDYRGYIGIEGDGQAIFDDGRVYSKKNRVRRFTIEDGAEDHDAIMAMWWENGGIQKTGEGTLLVKPAYYDHDANALTADVASQFNVNHSLRNGMLLVTSDDSLGGREIYTDDNSSTSLGFGVYDETPAGTPVTITSDFDMDDMKSEAVWSLAGNADWIWTGDFDPHKNRTFSLDDPIKITWTGSRTGGKWNTVTFEGVGDMEWAQTDQDDAENRGGYSWNSTGTLTLNATGTWALPGEGWLSINNGGTVKWLQSDQIQSSFGRNININNGTLDFNGFDEVYNSDDDGSDVVTTIGHTDDATDGWMLLGGGTVETRDIVLHRGGIDLEGGTLIGDDLTQNSGSITLGTGGELTLDEYILNGGTIDYSNATLNVNTLGLSGGTFVVEDTGTANIGGLSMTGGTYDLNGFDAELGIDATGGIIETNGAALTLTGGTMGALIQDSDGGSPNIQVTGLVTLANAAQTIPWDIQVGAGVDLGLVLDGTGTGTYNFSAGSIISGSAAELASLDSAASGWNLVDGMTVGFEEATTLPTALSSLTELTYGVKTSHSGSDLTIGDASASNWQALVGAGGFKSFGTVGDPDAVPAVPANVLTIDGDTVIADVQVRSKITGGAGDTIVVSEGTRFEPVNMDNDFTADIRIDTDAELTVATDIDMETAGFETPIATVGKLVLNGGKVQHWIYGGSEEIDNVYAAPQEYNIIGDGSTISMHRMRQMSIAAGNLTGTGDVIFDGDDYSPGTFTLLGANTHTGDAKITAGTTLIAKSDTSLNGSIDANGVYVADFAITQTDLDRVLDSSNGVIGLTTAYASGTDLDMSAKKDLFLGAYENMTVDGVITAVTFDSDDDTFTDSAAYNLGGAGAALTITSDLTDVGGFATDVNIRGTVILSGVSTFTGALNVDGTLGFGAVSATRGTGAIEIGPDVDGVAGNELSDILLSGIDATDYDTAGRSLHLTGGSVGWVGDQTITDLGTASSEVGIYTATAGGTQVLGLGVDGDSGTISLDSGVVIADGDFDGDTIDEAVQLVKAGESVLDLTGKVNTHSGGTVIRQGTIKADSSTVLGTGDFIVGGGKNSTATLSVASGETLTINSAIHAEIRETQMNVVGGGTVVFSTATGAGRMPWDDESSYGLTISENSSVTVDQAPRANGKYTGYLQFLGTGGSFTLVHNETEAPVVIHSSTDGPGAFRGIQVEEGAVANIHVDANTAVVSRGINGGDTAVNGTINKTGEGILSFCDTQSGGSGSWGTGGVNILEGTLMISGADEVNNAQGGTSASGHWYNFIEATNFLNFSDNTKLQMEYGATNWKGDFIGDLSFGDNVLIEGQSGDRAFLSAGGDGTTSYDGELKVLCRNNGEDNPVLRLNRSDVAVVNVTAGSSLNIMDNNTVVTVGGTGDALTDTTTGVSLSVTNNGTFRITNGSKHVAGISGAGSTVVDAGATLEVGSTGPVTQDSLTVNGSADMGDLLAAVKVLIDADAAAAVSTVDTGALEIAENGMLELKAQNGQSVVESLLLAAGGQVKFTGSGAELLIQDDSYTEQDILALVAAGQLMTDDAELVIGVKDVAAGEYLTKLTISGDANLDGLVDVGDLGILAGNWETTESVVTWDMGDFNGDGLVDVGDLGILAGRWDQSLPTGSIQPIPEPATMSLLALGGLAMLRRRRRK